MIQVRYSTSPSSVETAPRCGPAGELPRRGPVRDRRGARRLHARRPDGHRRSGPRPRAPRAAGLDRGARRRRRTWSVASSASSTSGRPATSSSTARSSSSSHLDGLYVGRGSEVAFTGADAAFYFVSAPAHATYPTTALSPRRGRAGAHRHRRGRQRAQRCSATPGARSSRRPSCSSASPCIADGSVWNTLPPHLHDRRTEVYLYVDLAEDDRVFHFLGKPGATRHLVMRNRQAVISPAVVHPRRRRHRLLRLHLGDGRREQRSTPTSRPSRWRTCAPTLALRPVTAGAPS